MNFLPYRGEVGLCKGLPFIKGTIKDLVKLWTVDNFLSSVFLDEFDSGSERMLVVCLTHAS